MAVVGAAVVCTPSPPLVRPCRCKLWCSVNDSLRGDDLSHRGRLLCSADSMIPIAKASAHPLTYSSNDNQSSLPDSLRDRCRALVFYATTAVLSVPLFAVMLVQQPFVLALDKHRRKAQHLINKLWATWSTYLFYKVDIVGKENLPHPDEPAVYVANHQSFIDIFVLFQLGRPFKFISKTSVFWIPIVGWAMYLTGHIPLRRLDTKSQLECFKRCIDLLKNGSSVFFFPEGTRSGTLAQFKKGAFISAAKAGTTVVPIALVGTGHLMPAGKEHILRNGHVTMVIHPPLRHGNADQLSVQARNCIATSLSEYGADAH